jgi:hypothetical protein
VDGLRRGEPRAMPRLLGFADIDNIEVRAGLALTARSTNKKPAGSSPSGLWRLTSALIDPPLLVTFENLTYIFFARSNAFL